MKELSLPKEIQGENVVLKLNALEHATEIFACVDADRQRLRQRLSWVDKIQTLEDEIKFIESSAVYDGKPMWSYGIFYKGYYVGNVSAHRIELENDLCEIGYWISRKYEGNGLVSEAVSVLEKCLFAHGLKQLFVYVEPGNIRSIKVAERNNYKYVETAKKRICGEEVELEIFVKTF